MAKRPIAERLWEKIDKAGPVPPALGTPCWMWTGGKDPNGYGRLNVDNIPALAHRLVWELVRGPIPEGLCALHRCDNPSCVNPEHIFLGTRGENAEDRDRKGRQAKGTRSGGAKLSPETVQAARRMSREGVTQREIAARLGVTHGAVWYVVNGRTWTHVESP